MKFTGQEEYGLRCMLQVAKHQGSEPLTIAEIADREGLSVPYVAKLMAILRKDGLVEGVRGRKGGYRMGRAPEGITVADVLAILGDQLYEDELCDKWTGEQAICVHNTDCTIRTMWKGLEKMIVDATTCITLDNLAGSEEVATTTIEKKILDSGESNRFKMISSS